MMTIILMMMTFISANFMNSSTMIYTLIIIYLMLNMNKPYFMFNMTSHYDKLSINMMILTLMTLILIILAMKYPNKSYFLLCLISTLLISSFMMNNIILFYIMFELTLIPTFMLIMKNGKQPERIQASMYLIMYTITMSLPMLLYIMFMLPMNSMILLSSLFMQMKFPVIIMLPFMVKLPMYSLHLWLPKAHVEAPMEGSMILAAVLLKLGGYGIIRIYPFIMKELMKINMWIMSISLMGAMYSSMMCTMQKDFKALIAYSSVSHMSLMLTSIMTMKMMSLSSSIIMMMSHGLTSSALFMMCNTIYSKKHSRNLMLMKSISSTNPNMFKWMFIFIMMNMAVPPSLNFMSETMLIMTNIQWISINMIIIFFMMLMTTSFSISTFITISHNSMINNKPENLSSNKNSMVMFMHSIPLILITLKTSIMI